MLGPTIKKYNEINITNTNNKPGYIYLIQTRTSVNINEEVYTFGKNSRKI